MELKIRNGDYIADGIGGERRADGAEALLERALFRLSVRRGSFPFLPELGSELYRLGHEKPLGPGLPRRSCTPPRRWRRKRR